MLHIKEFKIKPTRKVLFALLATSAPEPPSSYSPNTETCKAIKTPNNTMDERSTQQLKNYVEREKIFQWPVFYAEKVLRNIEMVSVEGLSLVGKLKNRKEE